MNLDSLPEDDDDDDDERRTAMKGSCVWSAVGAWVYFRVNVASAVRHICLRCLLAFEL